MRTFFLVLAASCGMVYLVLYQAKKCDSTQASIYIAHMLVAGCAP